MELEVLRTSKASQLFACRISPSMRCYASWQPTKPFVDSKDLQLNRRKRFWHRTRRKCLLVSTELLVYFVGIKDSLPIAFSKLAFYHGSDELLKDSVAAVHGDSGRTRGQERWKPKFPTQIERLGHRISQFETIYRRRSTRDC